MRLNTKTSTCLSAVLLLFPASNSLHGEPDKQTSILF